MKEFEATNIGGDPYLTIYNEESAHAKAYPFERDSDAQAAVEMLTFVEDVNNDEGNSELTISLGERDIVIARKGEHFLHVFNFSDKAAAYMAYEALIDYLNDGYDDDESEG